ncbi:MAG: hypothetical protein ACRD30_00105, partial [Bryobacteraceae bacterium]
MGLLETPGWRIRAGALLLLAAALILVGLRHEPWRDEAQSWLLARDSTMFDLVWRNIRYEGTPPLWQLILQIPARAGLPYRSMELIAVGIAWFGAALFAMNPRVPTIAAAMVPFTYFFAYQYSIVARSYCLVLPLFGLLALWHPSRHERPGRIYLVLNALAWVSAHAAVIAAALIGAHAWNARQNWRKHTFWLVLTAVD